MIQQINGIHYSFTPEPDCMMQEFPYRMLRDGKTIYESKVYCQNAEGFAAILEHWNLIADGYEFKWRYEAI